jgi:cation:H+ antiporter
MMIQATVPSGIGILFTAWKFNGPLIAAGVATMASVAYLRWLMTTNRVTPARLAAAALFYLGFAVSLIFTV